MKFEESAVGDVFVAKVLEGRITADVSAAFKAGLIGFVQQGHRRIVLDLSEVTFIDSSGLGALIGSLKAIGKDGELVLSGARDAVMSMFKLTRMNAVFRIFANVREAVSALSA